MYSARIIKQFKRGYNLSCNMISAKEVYNTQIQKFKSLIYIKMTTYKLLIKLTFNDTFYSNNGCFASSSSKREHISAPHLTVIYEFVLMFSQ